MPLFTNEEMIRLHHFIRCRATGTARILAKKLGCSKRKVHYLIERMRDEGLPIAWDDRRQTYYYEVEVSIQFSVTIGDKELMRIRGGNSAPQNIFEKKWPGASRLHTWLLILSLKTERKSLFRFRFPDS